LNGTKNRILMTHRSWLETPIGTLRIESDGMRIQRVAFCEMAEWDGSPEGLHQAAERQLLEYFAGTRKRFELPLRLKGTPFQLKVWEAVASIPYGETLSYQTIADRIGGNNAARAVGSANGANPLLIVAPCHRVIATDGTLTGYAGGLERKQWLLRHEGAIARDLFA